MFKNTLFSTCSLALLLSSCSQSDDLLSCSTFFSDARFEAYAEPKQKQNRAMMQKLLHEAAYVTVEFKASRHQPEAGQITRFKLTRSPEAQQSLERWARASTWGEYGLHPIPFKATSNVLVWQFYDAQNKPLHPAGAFEGWYQQRGESGATNVQEELKTWPELAGVDARFVAWLKGQL